MALQAVERLLKPRSVAIIGASDKPGALGASVFANLRRQGFAGEIHLINPSRTQIDGHACLPTIDLLPEDVDVAVLAIPRAGVVEAIRALAARRVGAAIIFSAGFAEGGDQGLAEQREIAHIAAAANMLIEGPNCLGHVNFIDAIPLTFIEIPVLPGLKAPGIGIISQSGAIATVVNSTLLSRGIGLSYSVSTGNEAGSGVEDYADYLLSDPMTRVIGMIVEQFRQPRRFLKIAARARQAGKSIVLLHPGRSQAARDSAATHTGAMAGDYELMSAKVRHAGVLQVETLEEFGDCLELLSRCGQVGPAGTLVIGESGAFKALTLDFAEGVGLHLPVATDADSPGLRAALPDFVPVSNPIDMTAQGLVDPAIYGRLVAAGVADARFDSVILGIIQTDAVTCGIKLPSIIAALKSLRPTKPVIFAGLDDGVLIPPGYMADLRGLGVPYFPSTERAFRAVARLAQHARPIAAPVSHAPFPLPFIPAGVVPEYQAKALLQPLGIGFPTGRLATTLEEALAAASLIGYPVVLKAQSPALSHKSDAGGVLIGIADAQALTAGWARLFENIRHYDKEITLDGVLVEAMGARGLELIIGGRNDPEWGPAVLVGFGGVQAEILKDVRLLPADLARAEILAELDRLKNAALLHGFRGAPACDVEAVAEMVQKLGRLLTSNPKMREIDLNPVIVYPAGAGAVALDALIYMD